MKKLDGPSCDDVLHMHNVFHQPSIFCAAWLVEGGHCSFTSLATASSLNHENIIQVHHLTLVLPENTSIFALDVETNSDEGVHTNSDEGIYTNSSAIANRIILFHFVDKFQVTIPDLHNCVPYPMRCFLSIMTADILELQLCFEHSFLLRNNSRNNLCNYQQQIVMLKFFVKDE